MIKIKYRFYILVFYIYLISSRVNGSAKNFGFVHNFYPGIMIRAPKTPEGTSYLTFPKLLFDYSSPFEDAHTFCRGDEEDYLSRPKEDVYFESGEKKQYNFNCTVKLPEKVKEIFKENILFNISGLSPSPSGPCCLLQVDKDKIDYLKGFKLNIPASPIGFSDLFFQVQFCSVSPIYSQKKMDNTTIFQQIVILDVTPSFMASSVYLFLGMAIFSLVLSCLIISAIIHRWKNAVLPDFADEFDDSDDSVEMKSITCDISYKTNEEKIQYYINKIDLFFSMNNVPPQKFYYDELGNSSCYSIGNNLNCSNNNNILNNSNINNNQTSLNNSINNNINKNNNINNNNEDIIDNELRIDGNNNNNINNFNNFNYPNLIGKDESSSSSGGSTSGRVINNNNL